MPSKKYRGQLSSEEQRYLQRLIAERRSKSQQVKRAYALLAADESSDKGWEDDQTQQTYGLSRASIERLRERLVLEGFERALAGKKREVFKEQFRIPLFSKCPPMITLAQLIAVSNAQYEYIDLFPGRLVPYNSAELPNMHNRLRMVLILLIHFAGSFCLLLAKNFLVFLLNTAYFNHWNYAVACD